MGIQPYHMHSAVGAFPVAHALAIDFHLFAVNLIANQILRGATPENPPLWAAMIGTEPLPLGGAASVRGFQVRATEPPRVD